MTPEYHPLREAVLAALPPEKAEAARVISNFALQALFESPLVSWNNRRELEGVADDLDTCASCLESYEDDRPEPALAFQAHDWRERLLGLAAEIREAAEKCST